MGDGHSRISEALGRRSASHQGCKIEPYRTFFCAFSPLLGRSLPELANNPLVERIIDTIDTDRSGDVDFQEFIMALSIFIRGDKESKLRCMC